MALNYFQVITNEWKKVVTIAVIVALAATLLSFVRPLEYGSTVGILIIQRSTLGLDPYTTIRSAERISENLAGIVYTTSFFEKVMATRFAIDKSFFKEQENKRRKQWQRMVGTEVARGTGRLAITIYHPTRDQALQIALAIGTVLQEEGWTYVGGGDLQVRIVDPPLTSRYPVRPNLPANAFAGFVLGLLGGIGYVVFLALRHPLHRERGFLHGM